MRPYKFRAVYPDGNVRIIAKENYLGSVGIIDTWIGNDKARWEEYTGIDIGKESEVPIFENDILYSPDDEEYLIVEKAPSGEWRAESPRFGWVLHFYGYSLKKVGSINDMPEEALESWNYDLSWTRLASKYPEITKELEERGRIK